MAPTSEEILHFAEQEVKRLEDKLREALANDKVNPKLTLALNAIMSLRVGLRMIGDHAASGDVVERTAVYRIIADSCAEFLRLPLDSVYPAVLALCGEEDANLLNGVAHPD